MRTLTQYHKPVLVHLELLDSMEFRTDDGRRITIAWGEPKDGIYEPLFTSHDDGKVLINRDVLAELERRAGGRE